MIRIKFQYIKKDTIIECNIQEKIKLVIKSFASKIGIDANETQFIYKGNIINDTELTIEKILDENDKNLNEMNVLVKEIKKNNNRKNKNYEDKINYKFRKNPNFKYKLDITNTNDPFGCNDIFEIYISFKDNKEYIISFNYETFNLEQFELLSNKKIRTLEAHNDKITSVRYFINNNNYNEYLVSAQKGDKVIIWDITNDYNKKYIFNNSCNSFITSSLLLFTNYDDNKNIIILKSINSYINVYSLDNAEFLYDIDINKSIKVYYFLSWYNKINNNYYILSLTEKNIIINNLNGIERFELKKEPEDSHLCGFIYNKDNNDYLCSSSINGYINIWDLYNKKIFKVINTESCYLGYIIEWNSKYIIVADYYNKSFKIVDKDNGKTISDIGGQNKKHVICVKKMYHPIYGESLLSASEDFTIKLWNI